MVNSKFYEIVIMARGVGILIAISLIPDLEWTLAYSAVGYLFCAKF